MLKPGYKQTDLGVLPEEWEVRTIGEIGTIIRGASPRPKGDPLYYGGDVPRLMVEDVTRDGKFVFPKIDFLTKAGAKLSRPCKKGTLTIVCSGTVGVVSFLGVDACIHDGFLALIKIDKSVWSDYLYYQFQSLRETFDASATHGGVFTNLTTFGVREISIPLPPPAEQQAIAEALGAVDVLLTAQRELLAKKRDLKQATQQALLSGERRLSGFEGEWEEMRLGQNLRFQVGFPFTSEYFNKKRNGLRLVKNRDLKADDDIHHYSGHYQNDYLVSNGDVLIGMDGDFMPCLWNKGKALLNQRVGRILTSSKLSSLFLFYFLVEPLKEIERSTASTTVKHLSHGQVENIVCSLPAIDEQRAIAAILSDMDAELEALATELAKTQALKQGLMQDLLTGTIRLTGGAPLATPTPQ